MTKKQFERELARRSNKRVPTMCTMTFRQLAELNESYISRIMAEHCDARPLYEPASTWTGH